MASSSRARSARSTSCAWARGAATLKAKVEPAPRALSTPIPPPMASARPLQIARPRPVPPWLRVRDASTWENRWKSLACSSSSRPGPVSWTATCSCSTAGSNRTETRTPPSAVNFMALLTRLSRIWRRRSGSSRTWAGRLSSAWKSSVRPLASAWGANIWMAARTSSSGETTCGLISKWPASSFEKSRTSLTMESSALPAASTRSRWRRAGGARSERSLSRPE